MTSNNHTADEAAIRALIAKRAAAISAKDASGVLATEAPEIVVAGLAPPLRFAGPTGDTREGMEAWFATWKGAIDYEVRGLEVTAGDTVAFCTGFVRIGGTKTDGEKTELWARQTIGLQKLNGTWKIVHDHHSVPFYMDGSLRAAVDLKPN
jgi:ketosteroid isomerase-like protein